MPTKKAMNNIGYSCKQVMRITDLTRRQLSYWRKTGLVVPHQQTTGGHARYTFTDLIALKSAKRLIEAGVSVQRIRKSILSLTSFLPTCKAPLSELSLVVTGDMILVLHRDTAFEALSGQEWIYPVAELERDAEKIRGIDAPQQGEMFTEAKTQDGAERKRRGNTA